MSEIVDGQQFDVEPGDFLHVPRGGVHEFKVLTPSSRMVAMYSPAGAEMAFLEYGTPSKPAGSELAKQAQCARQLIHTGETGADPG